MSGDAPKQRLCGRQAGGFVEVMCRWLLVYV